MEQYAKYLRKSRFDRDYAELSVEETLKRHEAILDKLAGERGYHIAKTYYEVVSGESIAARPVISEAAGGGQCRRLCRSAGGGCGAPGPWQRC